MPESFRAAATIILFGLETDLTVPVKDNSGKVHVKPLARIYAFSFEGHYYELSKPAIFHIAVSGSPLTEEMARKTEFVGLVGTLEHYSKDVMVWPVSKNDITTRFDVEEGTFNDLLLEDELRGDKQLGAHPAGSKLHMRARGGRE